MTSVVGRRAFTSPVAVSFLVMVGLPREYFAEPRLLALPGADAVVGNCSKILYQASRIGQPIVFMRMVGGAVFFVCATLFISWIERFGPHRKN